MKVQGEVSVTTPPRPLPTPTPPLGSAVYWLSSGVVESCLATRNMASSEEGSTHTRTIQKRAKKTQDQACQFDASLLEGERNCDFFFAYTSLCS